MSDESAELTETAPVAAGFESTDSPDALLAKWGELKTLVDALEHDVQKNATGTAAAGTRIRKGLRALKACASEVVKLSIAFDTGTRLARKQKRVAKAQAGA